MQTAVMGWGAGSWDGGIEQKRKSEETLMDIDKDVIILGGSGAK